MVLRYCLLADALYMRGHVVDHGCDTPVESFVVHSPYIEQVEPWLRRKRKLCSQTSLSNVPYAQIQS
jgi:hypothetical protein